MCCKSKSAQAIMQGAELHGLGLAHLLQSPEASTLNLNVLRRINPDISQVICSVGCTSITGPASRETLHIA